MGSPSYRLAAAITIPSSDEFLVVRQPPPPAAPHEAEDEYRRYVDSDLYDLPSAPLRPLQGELRSDVTIGGADSVAGRLDLSRLDVPAALDQILKPLGLTDAMFGEWMLLKYVEEAEFGPDAGLNTLLIIGSLDSKPEVLQDSCKWMSKEGASELLSEAKPGSTRIGPYVYIGILKSELSSAPGLTSQEYPPGITLVPMKSRTLQPFRTTNLVVVRAASDACGSKRSDFCGDALLIDPGCCSQVHAELADLVNSLPKKLVVLVTHHHNDHIDGLSVVQRCNPDAFLLTHENTMKLIGKGNWPIGYTAVTGGENICIGDQELQVVFAPGHTDGHMGVLHVNTNALVVGDHCVGTQCSTEEEDLAYHYFYAIGHESQDAEYYYKPDSVACVPSFSMIASAAETQIIWPDLPLLSWPHGSATLDSRAGGNMKDYFETTYKFLGMSPHVLIPMHGRINLWPKHMLCGYLRNRRAREASILKSIEDGAKTLFDIVSKTYGDVDRKLWIPASFNVRLHVEHLNSQDKLPKDFPVEKFEASCGIHFIFRWAVAYVQSRSSPAILAASALGGGLAIAYALKRNNGTQP